MKRVLSLGLTFVLIVSFALPYAKAEENKGVELAENAKSAILIERDTGTVLYDKNADERLSPASMTKIMTLLLNHGSDRKRRTFHKGKNPNK